MDLPKMLETTKPKDTACLINTYFNKLYSHFAYRVTSKSPYLTNDLSEAETPNETATFHFNIAADLFSSPGNAH